jgi:hypothetical protein
MTAGSAPLPKGALRVNKFRVLVYNLEKNPYL